MRCSKEWGDHGWGVPRHYGCMREQLSRYFVGKAKNREKPRGWRQRKLMGQTNEDIRGKTRGGGKAQTGVNRREIQTSKC